MLKKASILFSIILLIVSLFLFVKTFLNKMNNNGDNKDITQFIIGIAEHNQKEILYNPLLNQPCYFGKDSTKPVMLKEICDTNKIFFYFQTNASNRFEKIQIEGEVI